MGVNATSVPEVARDARPASALRGVAFALGVSDAVDVASGADEQAAASDSARGERYAASRSARPEIPGARRENNPRVGAGELLQGRYRRRRGSRPPAGHWVIAQCRLTSQTAVSPLHGSWRHSLPVPASQTGSGSLAPRRSHEQSEAEVEQ